MCLILSLLSVAEEEVFEFRKLHADVCEKLVSLCEVWEAKEAALEQGTEEDIPNMDDGGY